MCLYGFGRSNGQICLGCCGVQREQQRAAINQSINQSLTGGCSDLVTAEENGVVGAQVEAGGLLGSAQHMRRLGTLGRYLPKYPYTSALIVCLGQTTFGCAHGVKILFIALGSWNRVTASAAASDTIADPRSTTQRRVDLVGTYETSQEAYTRVTSIWRLREATATARPAESLRVLASTTHTFALASSSAPRGLFFQELSR